MSIKINNQLPDVGDIALGRLRRHTAAVRDNPDLVHAILGFLLEDPPNASAAREILELSDQQLAIDLWSQSPTAGGIWQTWMRDALKYGRLDATNSYSVYRARQGLPPLGQ